MTRFNETVQIGAGWVEERGGLVLDRLLVGGANAVDTMGRLAALVGGRTWAGALVAAALLCLGIVLLLSLRRRDRDVAARELGLLTRAPRRLGLGAASMFLIAFLVWGVFAPLASAVMAPGVIGPEGNRKTVQHLEGGIIRTIHVREGDAITEGDILITLDDTAARSLDAQIRERFLHVLAAEARLRAEEADASGIDFPPSLLETGSNELREVLDGQRHLLATRRAAHHGRIQILEARILQLREQNAGLRHVIAAQDEQFALVDEEIATSQGLLDQGLERKPRILALRRARAEIAASRAANTAKIAENEQAIGEARLQLIAVEEERREAVATELADVRRVLAELRGQLPSREDILGRTVIRSPSTGTVLNLRPTTVGGVVKPGEPLLDIVPEDAQLIINAQVRPTDVERIAPGMAARVILSAYRQRNMPLIHGRLLSISADAFADDRTDLTYFLAKVEVVPEDLAALSDVTLVPGMPAEVMLLDGERSLLEYLLAPIVDSRRRSFREN